MKLYCPLCTSEIIHETNQCPSCSAQYGPGIRELIRIIFEKGDKVYENEHRRQIRVQKTFKVSYSSPEHLAESYIHDFSLGGVFVETNRPLKPGEKLDLKIFLLDQKGRMDVPCEVVWCRKKEEGNPAGKRLSPGMGVKFLKLSEENLERLIDVLNRSLS